jgi:DNA-binding transcriptional regulator of glucitol operon
VVDVLRTAFRARWLPRHVIALLAISGLVLLGRWQWDVSESERGGLQNLLYALQWWAMALMVGYGWWRLLTDDAHGVTARRSVAAATGSWTTGTTTETAVQTAADDASWASYDRSGSDQLGAGSTAEDAESDRELEDYNRYLSWLNTRSERAR